MTTLLQLGVSLLEGTLIENGGQSDVFSALTFVVLQCTVACIADVERERGIGRKGKKKTLVLVCVAGC